MSPSSSQWRARWREDLDFLNVEALTAAARSTGAEPSTLEEWASLCNAQAVELEKHRSAALTAQAELTVLRLALDAADNDCACLQEAWLTAAEANLSARAALASTDDEPTPTATPTAQVAEPTLGSQLRQMEQLADACGRQASMQQRELEHESAGEEASEAMATAESETHPACEARHGHRLLCGVEAQPNDSAAWPEPAAWVELARAEPPARTRRVPLGESDRSRLNATVAGDAPTARFKAAKSVTTAPELERLAPAILHGTEEEVEWPVLEVTRGHARRREATRGEECKARSGPASRGLASRGLIRRAEQLL